MEIVFPEVQAARGNAGFTQTLRGRGRLQAVITFSSPVLHLINPRIGTGPRGNCLIGPCVPFGMVRLGPDIAYPQPNSGYRPGKALVGFSHTRLAGTGGAGRYGNFRIMPVPGPPRLLQGPPFLTFPATDRSWSRPVTEEASLGEYRCQFAFGVEASLTASAQVGVHRYRFADGIQPHILLDVSSILQNGTAPPEQTPYCEDWEMEGRCRDAELEILSDHEACGWAEHVGGWGHFHRTRVYFFLRSRERILGHRIANEDGLLVGSRGKGHSLRTVLEYAREDREIHLEVGLSFTSIQRARQAIESETAGAPFESVRERSREAWAPWLGLVETEGGTDDHATYLQTSLLRIFTQPVDTRPDGGRGYTDIVCLWDSIRNANSLQHLIAPEFSADLMNSLLANADETGWLPDAHIAGQFAYQQSGCCAEILFSEAARKRIPGVDYHHALAACIRNAETPSPDPRYQGRYLEDYEQLGFLSTNVPKGCVSRHIEYTYQDWCIGRLAEHHGDSQIARRFDEKSRRLWNLWNQEKKSFLPKAPDGSWIPGVDPEQHAWDGWNDPYSYESHLAFWSFCGLHDIPGLIKRHGGPAAFVHHLDGLLTRLPTIEKETRMITPHLYSLAGRPDRAAEVIRGSLEAKYRNAPDGMPDDEDMGCQSSYFICNSVGLYPIYGQTIYSLVPPLFEKSTLHFGRTGRALTILRTGNGPHITSARLNGETVIGTFVEHAALARGGTLEIRTA